ncbi:MAG: Hsp20/alpha crystallin family protein [Methylococcales bacterium]
MTIPSFETWMWAEACEVLQQADRLHRQFFRPAITKAHKLFWEPPADVYETPNEVKIMIALPGVPHEELFIQLENNLLTISGERRLPISSESQIHRLEIPYGCFKRQIELPIGHFEIGMRELINGCLLVLLRKM